MKRRRRYDQTYVGDSVPRESSSPIFTQFSEGPRTLFFQIVQTASRKDGTGSAADAADSPVVKTLTLLRTRYPQLLLMTDLCLCGYTDHGHW